MLQNVLVKCSLIFKASVTIWKRAIQLLLLHQIHGASAQQHGAAPTDVCLVSFQHHIRAAPVSEHHLAGEPLYQDLGDVLPVGPGD